MLLLATHIDGEARLLSAFPLSDQISKSARLTDGRLVTSFRLLSEFDHYCSNRNTREEQFSDQ